VLTTTTFWNLLMLGQAGAEATPSPTDTAAVQSVWDFVVKGGPMMIPIGVFSLVAMTVVMERLISLRRRHVIPRAFLPGLKEALGDNGDGRDDAIEYCQKNGSPIAHIFLAGIKRLGEPIEVLEKYILEAGEREVLKLRRYLRLLSVTAAIAPLMGLLGTIFGMIIAFQTVATSGEALGKAELLAKGIYQALITTAAGLMLAIPVLIAYHWFSAKIEGLVAEMDHMTVEFIEEYAAHGSGAGSVSPRLRATENSHDSEDEDAVSAAASA